MFVWLSMCVLPRITDCMNEPSESFPIDPHNDETEKKAYKTTNEQTRNIAEHKQQQQQQKILFVFK